MIKHYITILWRHYKKNAIYTLINILGLSISLSCIVAIFLYAEYELSYDGFHANKDNIYRVNWETILNGKGSTTPSSPPPMAKAYKESFPEVIEATRLHKPSESLIVTHEDKRFKEDKLYYGDNQLFDIFSFELREGSFDDLLQEPYSVVITEETSNKIFGNKNPIGKSIKIDTSSFIVKGICKNIPQNSHLRFDYLVSIKTHFRHSTTQWATNDYITYLLLKGKSDLRTLKEKMDKLTNERMAPFVKRALNVTMEEFFEKGNNYEYHLQPMKDIHMKSNIDYDIFSGGNIQFLYFFILIGIFIFIIALINYVNINVSNSLRRLKEIGIRKTFGATRLRIIGQFIFEHFVLALISFVVAMFIVESLLPYLNEYLSLNLKISYFTISTLLIHISIIILITIVATFSSTILFFKTSILKCLKGHMEITRKKYSLRSPLTIIQFTLSFVIISITLIFSSQINFLFNKQLGFDNNNILIIKEIHQLNNQKKTFRNNLLKIAGIEAASYSNHILQKSNDMGFVFIHGNSPDEITPLANLVADEHFIDLYNIEATKTSSELDSNIDHMPIQAYINFQAEEAFRLDDLVGKIIVTSGSGIQIPIAGTIGDIHFESLYNKIEPFSLIITTHDFYAYLSVKTNTPITQDIIEKVENIWRAYLPQSPFEYTTFADIKKESYSKEQRTIYLLMLFSAIAVIISMLGIWGATTFDTKSKIKSIAIKKVLGVSKMQIYRQFTTKFIVINTIAGLLSFPVSYFLVTKWLENFAYTINVNWSITIIIVVASIVFTHIIMNNLIFRAMNTNPIEAIKCE